MSDAYEARIESYGRAFTDALSHLGALDPHVLGAHIDEGPPFWPARRAYQLVRRPGRTILATAGLGHPWQDEPGRPGYGYELCIEFDEGIPWNSWPFARLARIAEWSIRPGTDLLGLFAEAQAPSFETAGDGLPDAWRSHTGRIGVLFGLPLPACPPTFDTSDGSVRLVCVTLLHPRELAAILEDPSRRAAIASELADRPRGHASLLDRELTAAALPTCAPYVAPAPPEPPARKPWWKLW